MLLRKAILSTAFAGMVGVAAWGTWGYWHGGAATLPLPTQAPNPTAARTAQLPGPHAVKAPQAPAGTPVAPAPSQPSFLYITYLPDAPESADGTPDGSADVAPGSDLGTPHQFASSRLRVSGKADEVVQAMLFSDDPKEAMAIDKNWAGDRYYFAIHFQQMPGFKRVEDRLDGAQWVYTASATEHEENGNGIYLHGDQMHLEPVYMSVQVEGQAPNLLVKLAGVFLQYDMSDSNAKPRRCQVQGILAPRVEIKN